METARVLVGKSIRKDLKKLSDKKVNSKKPKAKDSSLASLTRQIEKFWKIESLGIDSMPTREDPYNGQDQKIQGPKFICCAPDANVCS